MKVDINTKFNVGEQVYIPTNYSGTWYVENKSNTINGITITLNDFGTKITYSIEPGLECFTIINVPEEYVFANYEECNQWCINKGR
jgi:hypothetical protein